MARSTVRYERRADDDEVRRLVVRDARIGAASILVTVIGSSGEAATGGWQVNVKRIYRLWRREGFQSAAKGP